MARKTKSPPKSRRRPTYIRAWRRDRGLTLEQLSERLLVELEMDLSVGQLSRIERGEQAYNQDLLEAVAMVLRCSPADLLIRDPSNKAGIFSLWDTLSPVERVQAEKVIVAIKGTGTDG